MIDIRALRELISALNLTGAAIGRESACPNSANVEIQTVLNGKTGAREVSPLAGLRTTRTNGQFLSGDRDPSAHDVNHGGQFPGLLTDCGRVIGVGHDERLSLVLKPHILRPDGAGSENEGEPPRDDL